jgi:hypothetical protein
VLAFPDSGASAPRSIIFWPSHENALVSLMTSPAQPATWPVRLAAVPTLLLKPKVPRSLILLPSHKNAW